MNRLTKKCMVASAGMHALLILVLLVGPAFFSKKPEPMPPIITLVDATITDGATRGGGNPKVQEPPPPPPPEPPKEIIKPEPVKLPDPVVQKPEPIKPREPVVPKVEKVVAKPPVDLKPVNKPVVKPADPKPAPQFELKPTTRTAQLTTPPKKTDNSAQIAKDLAKLRSASDSIRSKTASSTSVESPGPGGEAFVNYDSAVKTIYQRAYDRALTVAGEIGDRDDSVDVAIVIGSNGRIISSRIIRNSGNPALNKLVKGVLDNVDSVPGFPPGTREAPRTYNITFDLKSRRLTG